MRDTRPRLHSLHWTVGPSHHPDRDEYRVRFSTIRGEGCVGFCVGLGAYHLAVYYQR